MNKRKMTPLYPKFDVSEALHYLCHDILGRKKYPNNRITSSYQEPTWGDIDIVQNLSQGTIKKGIKDPGNGILNALSVLGNSPKHLQIVRNTAMHLNKDTMKEMKYIVGYYRLSLAKTRYPTDILFSQDLATGKVAIKSWIDEMVAFLQLI